MAKISEAAPSVRLHFVPKHDADADLLRDGAIDLEIGKLESSAPELRAQFLFRDKYVGIARVGHPSLTAGKVTPKRYAAYGHVASAQLGGFNGYIDSALKKLQLSRSARVVMPGFPDAMRVAANSDLSALVPKASLANALINDRSLSLDIQEFEIPLQLPEILVRACGTRGLKPIPRSGGLGKR